MKLITLTSCSASGKDTILNRVLNETKALPIISTTNRPMRNGEIQGREYNFVSKEEAERLMFDGLFLEYRSYHVANGDKWIYGITKDSIDVDSDNIYITIVDFEGLKEIERKLGKDNVLSFYINTSCQERLIRSLSREGNMSDVQVQEVCRRLLDDELKVRPSLEYCNIVLRNEKVDDLDNCVLIIKQTVNSICTQTRGLVEYEITNRS